MVSGSHLLLCGWLAGWFTACFRLRTQAKESVEERQVVLVMWSTFFCWTVPWDKHVRIPAELCTLYQSACMSLSSSQALTHIPYLRYLLCHFFSFSLPSSYTLTLFPPASLCFSLSLFHADMHCCLSVFALYVSLRQCGLPITVGMPICLFLASSLFLLISGSLPGWLHVCFYFSLCTFLAVSLCLPLPPTLFLSVSALLHLSIVMDFFNACFSLFLFSFARFHSFPCL